MISAWTKKDGVYASYRRNGALEVKRIGDAEYAGFIRMSDPLPKHLGEREIREDFPGWLKIIWDDYDTRRSALLTHPSVLFEADVNPTRRFISDHKCVVDAPVRVSLDIESDSRVPIRLQQTEAPGRILSLCNVAFVGAHRQRFLLEDDDDEAEAEMLGAWWRSMEAYDQVVAWNGDGFDFPVINLRSEMFARRFPKLMEAFWEHRRRLLFMDHLLLFKRHHMAPESGEEKTSFKLDAVSTALLGHGKHDFDAKRTWEAWEEGGARRQAMLDYCEQDTVLLPEIEAETGYLSLQHALSELTLTFANTHGIQPLPMVDGYLMRKAHLRKTHLPSKRPPTGAEKPYEGAFVMAAETLGIHEMVHVCDFKSLYPTVIRTFNISFDTIDQQPGAVAFGTEVSFGTEFEGMIPEACRDAMALRSQYSKIYKADPNNKDAERKSKAAKIFNNSIYGVLGNVWARYYDVRLAESVTLVAKALIHAVFDHAKKRGMHVIYGDTDSAFIAGCTVEEFKKFVRECNQDVFPALLAARGVPPSQNVIELDYEKAFGRLVFPLGIKGIPAAKRYFGNYDHYGFKPKAKPEIRGLEYMRSDSIRYAKRMQKEVIDLILSGQDDPEWFEQWVLQKRLHVLDGALELADIVKSSSVKELDEYKTSPPHVRVALELAEAGEDVSPGTRIEYIVTNGDVSPKEVIAAAAYSGAFDRRCYWNDMIYPATMRVLAGAFPSRNWLRWKVKKPRVVVPSTQLRLT